MTGRFAGPVAPAADRACPEVSSAPSVPAVSSLSVSAVSPVPSGATAGRPAPARLADFGDVLSDADLCALLQVSPRWAEAQRREAKRAGVAPNLPARVPGVRVPRYRAIDVEAWLRTGSSKPAERVTALRRVD